MPYKVMFCCKFVVLLIITTISKDFFSGNNCFLCTNIVIKLKSISIKNKLFCFFLALTIYNLVHSSQFIVILFFLFFSYCLGSSSKCHHLHKFNFFWEYTFDQPLSYLLVKKFIYLSCHF